MPPCFKEMARSQISGTIIQQTGSENTANASQVGGDAFNNMIEIRQDGSENNADVKQSFASHMEATVAQIGQSNEAAIEQTGSFGTSMTASVHQQGNGNNATTTQLSLEFGSNQSDIIQQGDGNTANVDQSVNGVMHISSVTQIGNGNTADVSQAGGPGTAHSSSISVGGDANLVTLSQDGLLESFSTSSVEIAGNGNSAAVMQSGSGGGNASSIIESRERQYCLGRSTGLRARRVFHVQHIAASGQRPVQHDHRHAERRRLRRQSWNKYFSPQHHRGQSGGQPRAVDGAIAGSGRACHPLNRLLQIKPRDQRQEQRQAEKSCELMRGDEGRIEARARRRGWSSPRCRPARRPPPPGRAADAAPRRR